MAIEFTMPMLGEVMEEGRIVAWRKQAGDALTKGEILLEVETDKAVIEVESPATGVLVKILVVEDETVPVNTPLALID